MTNPPKEKDTPKEAANELGAWLVFNVEAELDDKDMKAILSLIESEKVKAVEEYKSAQKKEIPVPRGISGKKLDRILIDESRYVDPETAKLISDNIEELF